MQWTHKKRKGWNNMSEEILIKLKDFEEIIDLEKEKAIMNKISDEDINARYELGEARIVTEQGAIKLPLVSGVFSGGNYEKRPIYQRRITWDEKKRSRLIESFIMNIPVPPIFIYEVDYGKYEVMDGLQRVSAIIDFYEDKYELEGLTEWSELNGRKYSQLPKKIKEGIDRRQIMMISLLKESAKDDLQAQSMKRMVFERLNTGGVKLEEQEIRNALYDGEFNQMCKELSKNEIFRILWGIPVDMSNFSDKIKQTELLDDVDKLEFADEIAKNKLYMRMSDVELVLRFFAMRHLENYNVQLSAFLDVFLINGNSVLENNLVNKEKYVKLFNDTIDKVYKLFGEKAFCCYKKIRGNYKWSGPQKMIYDPLMLAVSELEVSDLPEEREDIDDYMQRKYMEDETIFDGKKQSKSDIEQRIKFFTNIILEILNKDNYNG